MASLSCDHLRHIVVLFLAVYSVSVLVFFALDFWQHSRAELIPRFGAYFTFPYGAELVSRINSDMSSYVARFGTMFKRYGPVLTGVHVTTSFAWYGAAFVAVHNGLDVPSMMAWISDLGFHCPEWASGLFGNHTEGVEHAPSAHDDTPLSEPPSKHTGSIPSAVQPPPPLVEGPAHATTQEADGATIVNSGVVQGASEAAIAYAAYKVLTPVRWPTTFALTPVVARLLNVKAAGGSDDGQTSKRGDEK